MGQEVGQVKSPDSVRRIARSLGTRSSASRIAQSDFGERAEASGIDFTEAVPPERARPVSEELRAQVQGGRTIRHRRAEAIGRGAKQTVPEGPGDPVSVYAPAADVRGGDGAFVCGALVRGTGVEWRAQTTRETRSGP